MRFFGLKSCDTCRKALKSLTAAGYTPTIIDIRTDGLRADEIETILSHFGDAAINRASTTWRGLSDSEKTDDPAKLLGRYPTLLKRPVIQNGDEWTIGWKADVQARYIGK